MIYSAKINPNQREKRLRKQTLKTWSLVAGSILLIGGIWIFLVLVLAPSNGKQVKTTFKYAGSQGDLNGPSSSNLIQAPAANNTYYLLKMPLGYKVQDFKGKLPADQLYVQNILGNDGQGSQLIAISISSSDGGLENNSAYQLRSTNPSQYAKSTETISAQQVTIFTDNQNSNVVAFWSHGPYILTISVSSAYQLYSAGGGQNPEVGILNNFLNNFSWK